MQYMRLAMIEVIQTRRSYRQFNPISLISEHENLIHQFRKAYAILNPV